MCFINKLALPCLKFRTQNIVILEMTFLIKVASISLLWLYKSDIQISNLKSRFCSEHEAETAGHTTDLLYRNTETFIHPNIEKICSDPTGCCWNEGSVLWHLTRSLHPNALQQQSIPPASAISHLQNAVMKMFHTLKISAGIHYWQILNRYSLKEANRISVTSYLQQSSWKHEC